MSDDMMRAVVLEEVGRLWLVEADRPVLEHPDQVMVQIKTVGICGSEVHAYRGTHPMRKPPTILGHEAAGVVVEMGSEVSGFSPGDRVFVDPQWTCGTCSYCRSGDVNLCPQKKVLGTPAWPGAFGEYVLAPASALFPLPAGMSFVQGSLVEPLTVAVHVARRGGVTAGEKAVVLGSGSIGGLVGAVCRLWGADMVVAADVRAHCLAAARRLGATHTILLPEEDLAGQVRALCDGEGAHAVFCTADDSTLVSQGVAMARRRGRIVLVALMTEVPAQIEPYAILSRELSLIGSTMCNHDDVQTAIELVARGEIDVEAIATHVLPIEHAQRGLDLARTKADKAIKVLLRFDDDSAVR